MVQLVLIILAMSLASSGVISWYTVLFVLLIMFIFRG